MMRTFAIVLLGIVVILLSRDFSDSDLGGQVGAPKAQDRTHRDDLQQVGGEVSEAEKRDLLRQARVERYSFEEIDEVWTASNPEQGLYAEFGVDGVTVRSSRWKSEPWYVQMKTESVSRGGMSWALPSANFDGAGQHLIGQESNVEEWYVNGPRGLEQGWTLRKPPLPDYDGELVLGLSLSTDLKPIVDADGGEIGFYDEGKEKVINYTGLKVWDRDDRVLLASMDVSEGEIFIKVDDRDANYPITIDPLFLRGDSYFRYSGDDFVVKDGNVVVGSEEAGEVTWYPQGEGDPVVLSGSNGFGKQVKYAGPWSRDGVLGVRADDGIALYRVNNANNGFWGMPKISEGAVAWNWSGVWALDEDRAAIYELPFGGIFFEQVRVYERDENGANSWGNGSYHVISLENGFGGSSLEFDGELLLIGQFGLRVSLRSKDQGGSNAWGAITELVPDEAEIPSIYGGSLDLNMGRAVVGSGESTVYVFDEDEGGVGNWGQSAKIQLPGSIPANSFVGSLALDGDRLLVSAGNRVFFYQNVLGEWELDEEFPFTSFPDVGSLSLKTDFDEDRLILGRQVAGSGRIYFYQKGPDGVWFECQEVLFDEAEIRPDDNNAAFGFSMSADGDMLVVGAPLGPLTSPPGESQKDTGGVYLFERDEEDGDRWSIERRIKPLSDPSDFSLFGTSVALAGDWLVVGAPLKDGSGAVYVFHRNTGGDGTWGQVQKISPPDGGSGDSFGIEVEYSEAGYFAVGSPGHDVDGSEKDGAVYIYTMGRGGLWTFQEKLTASDGASGDNFGAKLDASGEFLLVGSDRNDANGVNGSGAAYVFRRDPGMNPLWSEKAKLSAPEGEREEAAFFGSDVVLEDEVVFIGARNRDVGSRVNAGAVYHFVASAVDGSSWEYQEKMTAQNSLPDAHFGQVLDLRGDHLAIAAPDSPDVEDRDAGTVTLYYRHQEGFDQWGISGVLLPEGDRSNGEFGSSLALSDCGLEVGSPLGSGGGRFHSFRGVGDAGVWKSLVDQVPSSSTNFEDASVAIFGDYAVVGFPDADTAVGNDVGGVKMYAKNGDGWMFLFQIDTLSSTVGARVGESVAIDGEKILVGAPGAEASGGVASGQVFWFSLPSVLPSGPLQGWQSIPVTQPSSFRDAGDKFGRSIVLHGERYAIGASGDDGHGAVYLYPEVIRIVAEDAASGDAFGAAVALSGGSLTVGAPQDDDSGGNSGSIYRFNENMGGDGVWGQVQKIVNPVGLDAENDALDQFGRSISSSEGLLAVGVPNDQLVGSFSGAVYIYRESEDGNEWLYDSALFSPTPQDFSSFGNSVSLRGRRLAIGEPGSSLVDPPAKSVHVFLRRDRFSQKWDLEGTLRSQAFPNFGTAVSIFGGDLVTAGPDASFHRVDGFGWSAWQRYQFTSLGIQNTLTKESSWGSLADQDGDGLLNYQEAYHGFSPGQKDQFDLEIAFGGVGFGVDAKVISWPRAIDSAETGAELEYSLDMKEWHSLEDGPLGAAGARLPAPFQFSDHGVTMRASLNTVEETVYFRLRYVSPK